MFWERRTLLLITADMVAIVAAYLGAYFLRMNFHFTEPEGRAVLRALPIVLVVRSACFFWYGLYRTMWRYTGVSRRGARHQGGQCGLRRHSPPRWCCCTALSRFRARCSSLSISC
jgi:hypothetical protein